MTLGAVVLYVCDLQESVTFYRALLGLQESDWGTTTAALLFNPEGFQLYLRSVGIQAAHALGAVGTQFVVWAAPSSTALKRCEEWLKEQKAHIHTGTADGITWVEGRDPSHLPVMVTYPRSGQAVHHQILARIYAW
ncbi:VOC family protein [Streptomyces sp. NPDC006660]|uniref:VOC family protein n=1 Tax=Streptomyces sp. NPDC006660 TaxID=3156901 RepID=UPI0033FBD4C3